MLAAVMAAHFLLIIRQPNLSTAVVIVLIMIAIMVVAGLNLLYLAVPIAGAVAGYFYIVTYKTPYHWYQRLTSFADPFAERQGDGYQVVQGLIALGNGGLKGLGFGKSISKNMYLPEPQNDFILAILGEELGYIGFVLLMAAYIFLSEPRLLAGESFFFLTDLSKQDQLINLFDFKINLLPILMTIINILSSYVYTEKLSKSEKFQLYITAIVFLFLLYTSPSGLVFYWTCNNIFSLFKNIWMKYNFKISSPIKFDFISKTYSKIENLKFNSTVCFILSMILFWLITGVLFPFYIISLSPLELCEVCRDMPMWKILSYPALQSFGIFIFWGILIFYLTDNKFKNILSIFSVSTFILCIINYFKNYKIGLFLFSMEFFLNDKIVPFAISFAFILRA